jgi:hypothetical protein
MQGIMQRMHNSHAVSPVYWRPEAGTILERFRKLSTGRYFTMHF